MMNVFKNFKTKKQLRKENEKLKSRIDALLYQPQLINIERYELKTIRARTGFFQSGGIEGAKTELSYLLAKKLVPYIDYDVKDDNVLFDKVLTGTIQVTVKK